MSEPVENPTDVAAYLDRLDIRMADREMFVVLTLMYVTGSSPMKSPR